MTTSVDLSRTETYLKSEGSKCPSCQSPSIEAGAGPEFDGTTAFVPVSCNDCDAAWDATYTLSGIANIEGFDPGEPVASKEIALDYGIVISLSDHAHSISSELSKTFDLYGEAGCPKDATEVLETFLLAMAAEGVDLEASAMKSALRATVDPVGDHDF